MILFLAKHFAYCSGKMAGQGVICYYKNKIKIKIKIKIKLNTKFT